MAVTIKDIARETGLGLATVSSYLNGGNVREKNRVKIEAAIEKLHFEVNEVARGLRTNNTKTIGVIIPELTMRFCAEIITEMEDLLRSHGYAAIICDCRTDQKREQEAVEFLLHKRVDGLINLPVDADGNHLAGFYQSGKPMVLIDRGIPQFSCGTVLVDNQETSAKAIRYLISKGHRNIGLVVGPQQISAARERLLGYQKALQEAGITYQESFVFYGKDTMSSGAEGVARLHQEHPEITAVFTANHAMTMGAVIGLNEQGIQIGKDLSLIGLDNRQFARACNPKLTIVAQPTEEIAQNAAKLLLEELESGRNLNQTIILNSTVLAGNSVQDLNKEVLQND